MNKRVAAPFEIDGEALCDKGDCAGAGGAADAAKDGGMIPADMEAIAS